MKNKIFITTIFAALILLIFSGCMQEWLDVNEDPNNTKDATVELVFPAGVMSVAGMTGGYYTLLGGFWSQYWAQSNAANQYKYIDQYSIQSGDFNGIWREMYMGGISDLQYVIDKAEVEENWEYFLMATVMQAYAYQFMTDLHGDIPYTEALQGDAAEPNFNPIFDSQESIYTDLLARIDVALGKEFSELTDSEVNGDVVFNGDIDQWIRFANTLKLKLYIRMSEVKPAVAQAGIAKLYADEVEFLSSDAGITTFSATLGQENPLYANDRSGLNVATNLRVSTTIHKYFESNFDPRLNVIVQENENPMPQGGFNIPSTVLEPTSVCVFALNPTDPVYFISDVESYLLQAEAVARGWGAGSDDASLYNSALLTDFSRKGLDGSSFVATDGAYEYPSAGSLEDKIEAIIMAKWAAFAGNQCAEAFFETNRTGYPEVSSIPAWSGSAYNADYTGGALNYSLEGQTSGVFPKRMIYPQDEVNLNTNCPTQTSVTDRVWWDIN